jgi:hypothetical protein
LDKRFHKSYDQSGYEPYCSGLRHLICPQKF